MAVENQKSLVVAEIHHEGRRRVTRTFKVPLCWPDCSPEKKVLTAVSFGGGVDLETFTLAKEIVDGEVDAFNLSNLPEVDQERVRRILTAQITRLDSVKKKT